MADSHSWDLETDVLVVGSGAAALTAAVTAAAHGARVLVIEKSELFGGTAATSGGVVWIPASHHALAAGHADSPEEAFRYIRALTAPNVTDERIWACVRRGREMLAWLERHTAVPVRAHPYADYHPELPGGKLGWRSHEPLPLHARELGADFARMRPTHPAAMFLGRIAWTLEETGPLLFRLPGWRRIAFGVLGRYLLDVPYRFTSLRDRRLTLGNALVARLKLSLDRAGGELWLCSPLVELVCAGGRAAGALVEREGRRLTIGARRGIVLAAGGFERNAELRARHLPSSPNPAWSGSQPNNTGEVILAATRVGAATMNMDSAWWGASLSLPGEERGRLLTFERSLPGSIIVDQAGRRYMNEAASYHVTGLQMVRAHSPETPTVPSWILFDAQYRRSYPMGPMVPDFPDWMQPRNLRGVLVKARTWEALAQRARLPPAALRETVERFNRFARAGVDPDFRRGESAYDRYYGDPKVQPNPTLRALERPPFYALPIYPGDLGTNGGLVTDEHARVLDAQGRPIPGLYAAGNMAASVMGYSYPAAGATLGPGMTFGYIAARHLLGARESEPRSSAAPAAPLTALR